MRLRHVPILLLVLILILSACTPQAAPEEAAPAGEAPAEEEVAPAEEEVAAEEDASPEEADALQILGPWLASEADAFEYVLDGFRESTGIEVVYEGNPDVRGPLSTKVAAGEPPDLAILAVAKGLRDFVAQDALLPLDPFAEDIEANFSQGWIDQFTVDGQIYAVPTRSNINNLLWFNPDVVTEPPASWAEFTAYCDSLATEGVSCTAGIGKDSWTLDVLFYSAYISTNGVEMWNALMAGEVPYNDPSMVEAFNRLTQFYSDEYAAGGSVGALGTGLVDGIARVFGTSPDARFVNAGSWADGIAIGAINENLVPGETIDYVLFPGDPAGEGDIIAAADVAVMLVDSPEGRQLMSYLISAEGQARFAPNSYTVANVNVDPGLYSGLAIKTATLLGESDVGPDISVYLSTEELTAINEATGAAILDPGSIQTILDNLEASIGG